MKHGATPSQAGRRRIAELDVLRGVAVLMMLVSNFLFDLFFFAAVISGDSPFVVWLARMTAGLFLLVSGMTLYVRHPGGGAAAARHVFCRSLRLFGLGMVVTAATRLAVGDGFVVFGILHLIALGSLVCYPLLGRPRLCLVTGALIVAAAPLARGLSADSPWFLWLGIQYPGFYSVDYTPVVPWLGPMLIGVFAGAALFPGGVRRFAESPLLRSPAGRCLAAVGRRSLVIYFLHQPVFLAGLMLARWLA